MQRLVFAEHGSNEISSGLGVVSALALRPAVRAIKVARAMEEDRSTPPSCQQCAALQAELAAMKAERDEFRAMNRELRSAYEEHRRAQQALVDMYKNRERERERERDRQRERERVGHKLQ